ncbi:hypothetical protein MsAg5_06700 [Methanosarcinaceae archaeon Ag5]|uniref:DUF2283 domain-containing protein n=1 Tax=Methanolapillus africanus TaxID=3028297 RepID=A0AAE4SDP8_9EURY|nr:hypothetical protein [Methanosarcinaceae archaeon Ag5]
MTTDQKPLLQTPEKILLINPSEYSIQETYADSDFKILKYMFDRFAVEVCVDRENRLVGFKKINQIPDPGDWVDLAKQFEEDMERFFPEEVLHESSDVEII